MGLTFRFRSGDNSTLGAWLREGGVGGGGVRCEAPHLPPSPPAVAKAGPLSPSRGSLDQSATHFLLDFAMSLRPCVFTYKINTTFQMHYFKG